MKRIVVDVSDVEHLLEIGFVQVGRYVIVLKR